MATARDMMPAFALYQPASLTNALELAQQFGDEGWLLAGGQDSFDWFKDRAKRPRAVIDLSGVAELQGVRELADGVEIGALTPLAAVESDPLVRQRFGLLSAAAGQVASPQIRQVGTLGGNACQDARCWYYRSGLHCYRAGGSMCYANTPRGMNRDHCLFGANRCVAVSPSDTAPALVALDAQMVIAGSSGERVVPAEQFFIGPDTDIRRMTVLTQGEILTAIRLPAAWSGARHYFEKVADRNGWDFPLVNIAAALIVENDVIQKLRVVCGGVECVPRRLISVEETAAGSPKNTDTAMLAASAASRGAVPLNYNQFKIPLMQNLVKRAIRDA